MYDNYIKVVKYCLLKNIPVSIKEIYLKKDSIIKIEECSSYEIENKYYSAFNKGILSFFTKKEDIKVLNISIQMGNSVEVISIFDTMENFISKLRNKKQLLYD